jgi:hypothetical protein
MPSIITNSLRILNSDTFSKRISSQPTYLFIGKEADWVDDNLPPTPKESDIDKIQLHKDMLALKRVTGDSVSSVVPRINWAQNAIYDQYDHRINMIDDLKPNNTKYQFYVLTDEFNVYKCISNNNGAASFNKPTSQQITEFQTPDGYIWKYMYTIRSVDVFNYMTAEWIPIYTVDAADGSAQWQVQNSAIDGGIHNVVIDVPGASYSNATPPTVVITGDGTGATAIAEVNITDGSIKRIVITDPGSGYTTATISLTNVGAGVGAAATAILSPTGGHGKDSRRELGGVHKMIKVSIGGSEGGVFPTTTFRQSGLIYKPISTETGTKLVLTNTTNGFNNGDTVTGGTTGATGVVRLVDINERVLWLDTVVGTFIQTEVVTSQTGVADTTSYVETGVNIVMNASVSSVANMLPNSGELLYVSNRGKITRNASQTEEIRFIVSF